MHQDDIYILHSEYREDMNHTKILLWQRGKVCLYRGSYQGKRGAADVYLFSIGSGIKGAGK